MCRRRVHLWTRRRKGASWRAYLRRRHKTNRSCWRLLPQRWLRSLQAGQSRRPGLWRLPTGLVSARAGPSSCNLSQTKGSTTSRCCLQDMVLKRNVGAVYVSLACAINDLELASWRLLFIVWRDDKRLLSDRVSLQILAVGRILGLCGGIAEKFLESLLRSKSQPEY